MSKSSSRFVVKGNKETSRSINFSLADKEHLDTHPAFVHTVTEDVAIKQIGQSHLLTRHNGIDGLDLIAQFRSTFKFKGIQSLRPFFPLVLLDLNMATVEKVFDLINDFSVFLGIHVMNVRTDALSQMIVETRAFLRCTTFA